MTISVTMLQTRMGEDGTLWTVAGSPYDASLDFAYYLIGNGFATGTLPTAMQSYPVTQVVATAAEIAALTGQPGVLYVERDGSMRMFRWVAGAMQEVGAGSSGGVSGGGGDDVTDWGSFTGGKPSTVTVNGVQWTIGYTGANVTSYTVALGAADDLVVTVGYDNGYAEYSGNINVGGAVRMTLPQLKTLRDEVLAGLGVAARGFRARVEGANTTDALSWRIDSAGVTQYKSALLEWDGEQFIPLSAVYRETYQQATYVNTAGISGALRTIAFPGWLMGVSNRLAIEHDMTVTAGASGTSGTVIAINGGANQGATSGTSTTAQHAYSRWLLRQRSTSVQDLGISATGFGGYAVSSGANVQTTINTATTDVSVEFKAQVVTATDRTAALIYAGLKLEPK